MPFIVKHFGWDWFRHAQDYLLELFGGSHHQICFLVARRQGEIVGYCQQRLERFGPFGVDPGLSQSRHWAAAAVPLPGDDERRHDYFAYFLWTGEDAARLYSIAGFKRRREFAVLRMQICDATKE